MASPARTFSPRHAGELLDHLAAQIRRTIKRPEEGPIHDLRVTIRRFGQALAILKTCLLPESLKEIRASLKQIMSLAGEVRNCDITVKLLTKMEQRVPAAIARLRRQKEKPLVSSLQSWLEQDVASHWRAYLEPCRNLSAAATRKLLRQGVARAAERVHRRAADLKKSIRALHKLRIAAKKLRYTLELAGAPSDPVKDLQTRLGDINDYRAARRVLKRIPASAKTGAIAPLRDALAKKQRRKIRRFRREFKEPAPVR